MTADLFHPQVVQGVVTTRAADVPPDTGRVECGLSVWPAAAVRSELHGLFDGRWRLIEEAEFPGPQTETPPLATATKIRLVVELDRPTSLGITVTFTPREDA